MNTLNTSDTSRLSILWLMRGGERDPDNYNEEITHSFMADLGGNQNVRQTY